MAHQPSMSDVDTGLALPRIRKIGVADLREALRKGLDDFWAMPSHYVFLGMIYPVIGLMMARLAVDQNVLPLLFPMIAGFALIGPFAAIGIYELSRRRELGEEVSWAKAFGVLQSPSFGAVLRLGLILVAIFLAWMYAAETIYRDTFGYAVPATVMDFANQIMTTEAGMRLILIGNAVGFVFALAVLAISVISFPMLLDRHTNVHTAVLTSLKAVATNPLTMAIWGAIIAALLVIGSLPAFLGLAFVVPVLGHATWHLYRRMVGP